MASQSQEKKKKRNGNYLCQQMINANNDKLKVFDRLMSPISADGGSDYEVTTLVMKTEVMRRSGNDSRNSKHPEVEHT